MVLTCQAMTDRPVSKIKHKKLCLQRHITTNTTLDGTTSIHLNIYFYGWIDHQPKINAFGSWEKAGAARKKPMEGWKQNTTAKTGTFLHMGNSTNHQMALLEHHVNKNNCKALSKCHMRLQFNSVHFNETLLTAEGK